jgi:hypothetical protein
MASAKVVAAGVVASAAVALLFSKRSQAAVDAFTRKRLRARHHVEPTAADIEVAH